jgi:hypothetical protein
MKKPAPSSGATPIVCAILSLGAQKAGEVAITPHPCAHFPSADPLRSRADMAAIFGRYFILPNVLAEVLPIGDPGDGVGVVYRGAARGSRREM